MKIVSIPKLIIASLILAVCFETVTANFQIKVIRKAIQKAIKYGPVVVGDGVTGNRAIQVLKDIDRTLSYLGLNHWVGIAEFQNAAVRVGLSRDVGNAVYHIMDLLI